MAQDYLLQMKDDMIEEGLLAGDRLIYHEADDALNGDLVVAIVDGNKPTVKRFFREKGLIRLQPAIKSYPPLILEPDRVKIKGIIDGIHRRMEA